MIVQADDHGAPLPQVHSEMEPWQLLDHLREDHHYVVARGAGGAYAQRLHARLHGPLRLVKP